jgi:mannan endo-1,4-beta-mannosidase
MKKYVPVALILFCLFLSLLTCAQHNKVNRAGFVRQVNHQFVLANKPWYFVGANYWYGPYLGMLTDKKRGIERLRKELDFLKQHGVTCLRVLGGAEGAGQINGVQRVGPALQPKPGVFDDAQLKGLDVLLYEMGKRNLKAVIFLSNNWEWSGGFLQYLNWNGLIDTPTVQRKLNWDEQRDYTSRFYSCSPCIQAYLAQVKYIINRINTITGKKYKDDPVIMSWELANEPRPMRPAANDYYLKWISNTAAFIKLLDKNHLITTGHEGEMATDGDLPLYEAVHADPNINYLTIHIWPKNWSWFQPNTLEHDLPVVKEKTRTYINKHVQVAEKLHKPLVIEEFGIPRDGHSFNISATTNIRGQYYRLFLDAWQQHKLQNGVIAGINFWAFAGAGRPIPAQVFWKQGDDYLGDPPMEEQGLNSVFDSDSSTWKVIDTFTKTNAGK